MADGKGTSMRNPSDEARCSVCGRSLPFPIGSDTSDTLCSGCRSTADYEKGDPGELLLQMVRERRSGQKCRVGPYISNHQLEKKIGQGGFGSVYLAKNQGTGQR